MTSSPIPFVDLKRAQLEIADEVNAAIASVLEASWFIGGAPLERFEEEFAHYTNASHCVGVASGLDALILALKAVDVGPGDEVIVPVHTYVATYIAVMHTGATVVPVACGDDYLIDPNAIAPAITNRTKALLPGHLYGQACDMDPILQIATAHDLYVVEDAAQSHGARYKNRRIGSFGDVTCWSFYPGKNLGAYGDGGAITTMNPDVAKKIQRLGNYGSEKKYYNLDVGYNSRLDTLQAAILSVKLRYLNEWNARRSALADHYLQSLPAALCPITHANRDHVWHLFPICLPSKEGNKKSSSQRDVLQAELMKKDIHTLIHYPLLSTDQPCMEGQAFYKTPVFEKERRWCDNLLSLPISPHHTSEEITRVIDAVHLFKDIA